MHSTFQRKNRILQKISTFKYFSSGNFAIQKKKFGSNKARNTGEKKKVAVNDSYYLVNHPINL